MGDLWRIRPFETLWSALGDYFHDPRLRQLFGRYATYCGSSPFLAPATLMLVAHVEQRRRLAGRGRHGAARASTGRAGESHGRQFRYGVAVRAITAAAAGLTASYWPSGERIDADAVVVNADTAALAAGLFGAHVARAAPPTPPASGRCRL